MAGKKPVKSVITAKSSSPDNNSAADVKQKTAAKGKPGLFLMIVTSLAAAATVFVVVCAAFVYAYLSDLSDSRKEKDTLVDMRDAAGVDVSHALDEDNTSRINAFDEEMLAVNEDYICWIKIDGTVIDYPVVRADDNEKYMDTAFSGGANVLGAIFMDYRCAGEYVPHIIIYGHNAKEGDMFGTLRRFLDDAYLKEHPVITLTANGRKAEYEIFAARKTDINDIVYDLDFNAPGSFAGFRERCRAPAGARQILTLSTCVSGSDPNERVIVQAALVDN